MVTARPSSSVAIHNPDLRSRRERRHDGAQRGPTLLLDHLGAVIDHVEPFVRGGLHDEPNFVTSCNKCNVRKNAAEVSEFERRSPRVPVKGKYGEPSHWDGMTTLFMLLAYQRLAELSASELAWLKALRDGPSDARIARRPSSCSPAPG
jgi:hypothetical protein